MNADAVVIGGGAAGTSVAYYLAKKDLDPDVVERGGLACGTSGSVD